MEDAAAGRLLSVEESDRLISWLEGTGEHIVARRIRLTVWYSRTGTSACSTWYAARDRHRSGRVVRGLADATELPGPQDYESTVKPVGRAWVRRVPDRNLWVWYRVNDDELIVLTVTTEPPVPADE